MLYEVITKGVVDERDDLNLGMLGMFGTPYANMLIQENDFFFAIGVRWDDRVAEKAWPRPDSVRTCSHSKAGSIPS